MAQAPTKKRAAPILLATLTLLAATLPAVAQPTNPTTPTLLVSADSIYTRAGAPILLTGRLLPNDATGTVSFSTDGLSQTVPITQFSQTPYAALGDSITYDGYIADPAQRYPALIASALSLTAGNYASPGYTACDVMPTEVLPAALAALTSSPRLYSLLIGANDISLFGLGPHEALFNLCHQATLAWLGTPRQSKLLPGDPNIAVTAGAWTAAPALGACCLNALTASAPATLRFTLTSNGGAAYLWYVIQTAAPGAFTVSVDAGQPAAPISTQPATSFGVQSQSIGLLRLPVSAGTHTFDVAAQSGPVAVLGMGSAPVVDPSSIFPIVLASDIPNQINGSSASIAEYTADIQSNLATLKADGLDLRFVPTQQYMLATSAEMMDNRHPNFLGLTHLAQAFESVLQPFSAAPYTTLVAAATLSTSSLALGSHTVTAAYSGDQTYSSATGQVALSIYDGSSSTTLSAASPSYPLGTPITLTAAIPQPNASGSVTFAELTSAGVEPLGYAWIVTGSANTAVLTLPSLPAGVHTLQAQYTGDIHFNPSASPTLTVTVITSTNTSLASTASHFPVGSPVPLTATVNPSDATGTITFYDGAQQLAQLPLTTGANNPGTVTFTTSTLTPGTHNLFTTYSGDPSDSPSESPALPLRIDQLPATLTLASSPAAASTNGTAETLTVTIVPASATGSITLRDSFAALSPSGASSPAVLQTLGQPPLTNGSASLTLGNLAVGTHTLTAVYAGDTDTLPGTSSNLLLRIDALPTSTTLSALPANLPYGSPATLNASVTPAGVTGTVTFQDVLPGSATPTILAQVSLTNGSASFAASALTPGPHLLTAVYSGDATHAASTSTPDATQVGTEPTSTTLAPLPPTLNAGNPTPLIATVTPASATGTVTFTDTAGSSNQSTIGQATLTRGTAAFTSTSLALGSHTFTAIYSGDPSNATSTSASVSTQVVLTPTSLTLASLAGSLPIGTSVPLSASLTPASATGSVAFSDSVSGPLGSAPLVNGIASLKTSTLPLGPHTLHAAYAGDSSNAAATASPLSVTIVPDTSTTTLTLAQTSVPAGSPVVFNVQVANLAATIPSGSIVIRSGASVLASAPLANATSGLAYATLSTSSTTLGLGTFSVIASYSGDPNDTPADSIPASFTIAPIPTTGLLTLSASQLPPQTPVTLTATFSAPANAIPTGTVTFLNNGQSFATSPLTAAGTASTTLAGPSLGPNTLTATLAPTGLFAASTTPAQTLTVTPPVTLTLNPATLTAALGSTATAALTISPLSGFSGSIAAQCAATSTLLTCTVDAPTSIGSSPITATVHLTVAATTSASLDPALPHSTPSTLHPYFLAAVTTLALLFPLLRRRRPLPATLLLLLAFAAFTSLTACSNGGTYNSMQLGTHAANVSVTAAGTTVTATLQVSLHQ